MADLGLAPRKAWKPAVDPRMAAAGERYRAGTPQLPEYQGAGINYNAPLPFGHMGAPGPMSQKPQQAASVFGPALPPGGLHQPTLAGMGIHGSNDPNANLRSNVEGLAAPPGIGLAVHADNRFGPNGSSYSTGMDGSRVPHGPTAYAAGGQVLNDIAQDKRNNASTPMSVNIASNMLQGRGKPVQQHEFDVGNPFSMKVDPVVGQYAKGPNGQITHGPGWSSGDQNKASDATAMLNSPERKAHLESRKKQVADRSTGLSANQVRRERQATQEQLAYDRSLGLKNPSIYAKMQGDKLAAKTRADIQKGVNDTNLGLADKRTSADKEIAKGRNAVAEKDITSKSGTAKGAQDTQRYAVDNQTEIAKASAEKQLSIASEANKSREQIARENRESQEKIGRLKANVDESGKPIDARTPDQKIATSGDIDTSKMTLPEVKVAVSHLPPETQDRMLNEWQKNDEQKKAFESFRGGPRANAIGNIFQYPIDALGSYLAGKPKDFSRVPAKVIQDQRKQGLRK